MYILIFKSFAFQVLLFFECIVVARTASNGIYWAIYGPALDLWAFAVIWQLAPYARVRSSGSWHLFPRLARKVPTHWEFESGSPPHHHPPDTEVKIEMNSIPLTLLRLQLLLLRCGDSPDT